MKHCMSTSVTEHILLLWTKSTNIALKKFSNFFIWKEGQLFYTGGKSGANNLRLVIQQDKEKRRVISNIHDQAHLGRDKTATAVRSRYYWTNLYNYVSRYVSWNLAV